MPLDRVVTLGIVRGLCSLANLPPPTRPVTAMLAVVWHTGGHMDATNANPVAALRPAVPSGTDYDPTATTGGQQASGNSPDRPSCPPLLALGRVRAVRSITRYWNEMRQQCRGADRRALRQTTDGGSRHDVYEKLLAESRQKRLWTFYCSERQHESASLTITAAWAHGLGHLGNHVGVSTFPDKRCLRQHRSLTI